jgi:SNF2 family DNA or RNA helicase
MNLTAFHAKYFAHELTKRSPSDRVEMLAGVLADAQVDLNPHQIEAALFAFRNPFSRGAILADEVGLGKTIEAGLLLAQRWAERKRKRRCDEFRWRRVVLMTCCIDYAKDATNVRLH